MPTLFRALGALLFDGITTTERDDLNAKERLFIFNTTTNQFEINLSGTWYGLLLLDSDGTISSGHHGSKSGDLHVEYARTAAPEEITASWVLASGGSIRGGVGDPPVGEVGEVFAPVDTAGPFAAVRQVPSSPKPTVQESLSGCQATQPPMKTVLRATRGKSQTWWAVT